MAAWLFVGSDQQIVGAYRESALSSKWRQGVLILQAFGAAWFSHASGMSAKNERSSSDSSDQDMARPSCVMSFASANACSGPRGSPQSPAGRVRAATCQFRHSVLQERDRGKDWVVFHEASGWQTYMLVSGPGCPPHSRGGRVPGRACHLA